VHEQQFRIGLGRLNSKSRATPASACSRVRPAWILPLPDPHSESAMA
jgi:hypothetical protein